MKNMMRDGFETIDTTVDDYFDNMDETGSPIDRPSRLESDKIQRIQAYFAGAEGTYMEQAIEARLRFGKDSINTPKCQEIILEEKL